MFTRKDLLLKKTGPDGIGRYDFLKQLIVEYTTTKSAECRKQTLANLANFGYDPINYEFFKQLHVADLFLAQLSEDNEDLLHFAVAGLCNISPDPENRDYIVKLNGIKLISNQLLHPNEDIALNSLTTLYYLTTAENSHILTPEIVNKIKSYQTHRNPRYRNLGTVFVQNYLS